MLKLFILALAPTLICLFYIYIRDKYEKEPVRLLITGVLYGGILTAPIVQTEHFVTAFIPITGVLGEAFYSSFAVASLVEEAYKWILLYFLVWKNREYNEHFDGIVYAVFISLGFAGVENVMYVFNPNIGGLETAISRAFFSVPGHGLFGVAMGYYFSMARFEPEKQLRYIVSSFVVPYLLHGVYDFILLSQFMYLMVAFVAFTVYLYITGFKKINAHLKRSPFKGRHARQRL